MSEPSRAAKESAPRLGYQPLYAKVRDAFVQRLVDGSWQPGQALPSEIELAAEIGVSQGTVRKALDALVAENLVIRQQGRGTFVAEHDETRVLFQFFRIVPDQGQRSFPESLVLGVERGAANAAEAEHLDLRRAAQVVRIRRMRSLAGKPAISERLVLPAALFVGLEQMPIPNNLYGFFARHYRVTVAHAREKLKAVTLDSEHAAILQVPAATPALCVDRLAFGLDGVAVEWRLSFCLTEDMHYSSEL